MKKLLTFLLCSVMGFAANAVPAAISSTSVSGVIMTVNTSTPHGLAPNQGACLSAPSSVCGVVASTPTGSQFMLQVGSVPAPCSSACGTSSLAPQVIILQTQPISQAEANVSYVIWLTTQQPCPSSQGSSAWQAANGSAGANSAQLAAIQTGLFVERVRNKPLPANTLLADLQKLLQNDYLLQQQAEASNVQPCVLYGQTFDSIGWAKQ